jgi:hypothetical protein
MIKLSKQAKEELRKAQHDLGSFKPDKLVVRPK